MKLLRLNNLFPPRSEEKTQHLGPVPGGRFWALADVNDLPHVYYGGKRPAEYLGAPYWLRYEDYESDISWMESDKPADEEYGERHVSIKLVEVELETLLANDWLVWWRDADSENSEWVRVYSENDLPEVKCFFWDDYDGCCSGTSYSVMPELYAVRKRRVQ